MRIISIPLSSGFNLPSRSKRADLPVFLATFKLSVITADLSADLITITLCRDWGLPMYSIYRRASSRPVRHSETRNERPRRRLQNTGLLHRCDRECQAHDHESLPRWLLQNAQEKRSERKRNEEQSERLPLTRSLDCCYDDKNRQQQAEEHEENAGEWPELIEH